MHHKLNPNSKVRKTRDRMRQDKPNECSAREEPGVSGVPGEPAKHKGACIQILVRKNTSRYKSISCEKKTMLM